MNKILRRNAWIVLLLLSLGVLWYMAFDYLVDFRTPDVPFVTTPHDVVNAMLDMAEVKEGEVVYDLGSGDGRMVIAAARDRGARAVGIEIDPTLAERSRQAVTTAGLQDKITIRRGDIFKQDISSADVVLMFLKPDVNEQLRVQFDSLKPGTRIVSHMFSIPGSNSKKVVEIRSQETEMEHKLYLYVTPIEWTETAKR